MQMSNILRVSNFIFCIRLFASNIDADMPSELYLKHKHKCRRGTKMVTESWANADVFKYMVRIPGQNMSVWFTDMTWWALWTWEMSHSRFGK